MDKITENVSAALADTLAPGEEIKAVYRGMIKGAATGMAAGWVIGAAISTKAGSTNRAARDLGFSLPGGTTSIGIALTNQRLIFCKLGGLTGKNFKELRGSIPLSEVTGVTSKTVAINGFLTVTIGEHTLKFQGQTGVAKQFAEAYAAL